MLEYNFTELDNDFITLWSRYIVTDKIVLDMNALQELAEKGQINAVQKWYWFNKKGVNSKIDAIVESYKGDTYNELFSKAIVAYSDDYQNYLDLVIKIHEEHKKWNRYDSEENYKNFGNLRKAIYEHPICSNLIKAKELAKEEYEKTNNYLVLETMNEILNIYNNYKIKISDLWRSL